MPPHATESASFLTNALPVLAGVAVGWLLAEGTGVLRDARRLKHLRAALAAECATILNQLPQLKELVGNVLAALQLQRVLPGGHVHPPRMAYDAASKDLIARLPAKERHLLHVAFEYLRVTDNFLDYYARNLLADLKEGVVDDPWTAYQGQAKDIAATLDVTSTLLSSYLAGEAIDPFPSAAT